MVALGRAVSSAVSSGRHEITKGMRKTPSIGPDIERWRKVTEVQIPGTKNALYRAFLDSLGQNRLEQDQAAMRHDHQILLRERPGGAAVAQEDQRQHRPRTDALLAAPRQRGLWQLLALAAGGGHRLR